MSYFDPEIYNKQNLKPEDRSELDFVQSMINDVIDSALSSYVWCEEIESLKILKKQIAENFSEHLKEKFGYSLNDICVSIIDGYEDDVQKVEDYETYLYIQQ